MNILGINAFHGDVAAALVRDGTLVAAVEEERFRRVKHWAGFPREAVRACLAMGGLEPRSVDWFAVSRDPHAHLLRKAWFALSRRPSPRLLRDRLRNSGRVGDLPGLLAEALGLPEAEVRRKTRRVEHHPAHLASAFFVSPFDEAAVCAIDGFGDFVSTSFAVGRGRRLDVERRIFFPHSLGLLYLAVTQYLGFMKYGDEYKVMGLAPYGEPSLAGEMRRLVHPTRDGGFRLDLAYFRHHTARTTLTWEEGEPKVEPVFTPALEALLGPARRPDEPVTERHEAVAASLQLVFEEAALHLLRGLAARTGQTRLCLAGGCAMNSVMNGKIRAQTPFREVFIQPAAGDNGTALGAAFHVWNHELGGARGFVMEHSYWGPSFGRREIERALGERDADLRATACTVRRIDDEGVLCAWTAERLAHGNVVGWFQGRMEWGARALGNRSILADPRRADMREVLNRKIKLRESFRPFAPSVGEEAVDGWFAGAAPDPFMLQVYPVREERRSSIPAVTHVDGSGRLQTVHPRSNPRYARLIEAFRERTGVPIVLNTSFNENEPIVHRPGEALDCFLRTQMDVLVLGDHVITKSDSKGE